MSAFKENLRKLRKELKLTQTELADKVGLNRPVIGAYEEGRAEPSIKVLNVFADFFGVTLDLLINEQTANQKKIPVRLTNEIRVLPILISENGEKEFVPLVPLKAAAGYLSNYSDPEFIGALSNFALPFAEMKELRTYRMFQIEGKSMLPVPDGAYIITSFVDEWGAAKRNECYVFVTDTEGIVYKRLKEKNKAATKFTLQSDNIEFGEFEIEVKDIREIWKAHGFVSFALPQPD